MFRLFAIYITVAFAKPTPGVWRIPGYDFSQSALAGHATQIKLAMIAARKEIKEKGLTVKSFAPQKDKVDHEYAVTLQKYQNVQAESQSLNTKIDELQKRKVEVEAFYKKDIDNLQAQLTSTLASKEKQGTDIQQVRASAESASKEMQEVEKVLKNLDDKLQASNALQQDNKRLEDAFPEQEEIWKKQHDQITQLTFDIENGKKRKAQMEAMVQEIQAWQIKNKALNDSITKIVQEKENIQNALRQVRDEASTP